MEWGVCEKQKWFRCLQFNEKKEEEESMTLKSEGILQLCYALWGIFQA